MVKEVVAKEVILQQPLIYAKATSHARACMLSYMTTACEREKFAKRASHRYHLLFNIYFI